MMSKRLQVILPDGEYRDLQRVARGCRMSVSAWVRAAIRTAQRQLPDRRADHKIGAVREAVRHAYPAGEVGDMLAEIERGYLPRRASDLPRL